MFFPTTNCICRDCITLFGVPIKEESGLSKMWRSHWRFGQEEGPWEVKLRCQRVMARTHGFFLRCFFSGTSLVITGMCTCSLSARTLKQRNPKTFFIPFLHGNVDFLLSLIKLTDVNFLFCFVIVEEIASENSDSIYSSTPEVKAWVSCTCPSSIQFTDRTGEQRPASAF